MFDVDRVAGGLHGRSTDGPQIVETAARRPCRWRCPWTQLPCERVRTQAERQTGAHTERAHTQRGAHTLTLIHAHTQKRRFPVLSGRDCREESGVLRLTAAHCSAQQRVYCRR